MSIKLLYAFLIVSSMLLTACGGGGGDTPADASSTDTTPNTFVLIDITDVPISTIVISNTIIILGVNSPSSISVLNGEYSINGGSFTAASGVVVDFDRIIVRHTSSSRDQSKTTSLLTVGGISDTFSSTTTNSTIWKFQRDVDNFTDDVTCWLYAEVPGSQYPVGFGFFENKINGYVDIHAFLREAPTPNGPNYEETLLRVDDNAAIDLSTASSFGKVTNDAYLSGSSFGGLLTQLMTGDILKIRFVPQNALISIHEVSIDMSGFSDLVLEFDKCVDTIGSENTQGSVAKLYFVNDLDNNPLVGNSLSIINGVSSTGKSENFSSINADVNDLTPNIINPGEVGYLEIESCDELWEFLLVFDSISSGDENQHLSLSHDMQLFSCNREYTCNFINISAAHEYALPGLYGGELSCSVN